MQSTNTETHTLCDRCGQIKPSTVITGTNICLCTKCLGEYNLQPPELSPNDFVSLKRASK